MTCDGVIDTTNRDVGVILRRERRQSDYWRVENVAWLVNCGNGKYSTKRDYSVRPVTILAYSPVSCHFYHLFAVLNGVLTSKCQARRDSASIFYRHSIRRIRDLADDIHAANIWLIFIYLNVAYRLLA